VLGRIEAGGVEPDDAQVLVAEHGPRPGREVLQPGTDRQHDIGLRGQLVGLRRAGDSDRPRVERMLGEQRGLARHRLDDGHVVLLGEAAQARLRQGVVHAPPGHDQGRLGAAQRGDGRCQLAMVGAHAAQLVHDRLEQPHGVVIGLRLDVLGQPEEGRAAIGRVEHRGDRERERLRDLRRAGDAIPVARHRPERVVDRDRWLVEVLDLLQHGIGDARMERVARQQQQGQPVGVRDRGRRDHVRRARADGGRRRHELAAAHRLCEADRGQCHPLLALAAERRQHAARVVERLAQAGDVAVAEDAEHARDERPLLAVYQRALNRQEAHDRLRRGEPDRAHRHPSTTPAADVIGQRGSSAMPSQRSRIQ
jgi:hypothetical protein